VCRVGRARARARALTLQPWWVDVGVVRVGEGRSGFPDDEEGAMDKLINCEVELGALIQSRVKCRCDTRLCAICIKNGWIIKVRYIDGRHNFITSYMQSRGFNDQYQLSCLIEPC
jgi:hypothetical protein